MTSTLRPLLAATLACAMGTALTVRVAQAETEFGVTSMAEAKSMYQHDVAACRQHKVDEDMKTCMKEAQRAYDDAKREAMHAGKPAMRQARADRG